MKRNVTMLCDRAGWGARAKIVYDVSRTDSGWRLSAFVPLSVPPKDRITVVQWMGDYRMQIKRAQPDWLVRFKVDDPCHYELDVLPMRLSGNPAGKSAELEKINTLWHQLSFDYA